MKRECTRCGRPFTPPDLARTESKNMEADRKAAGLEGVRFLYYRCPCGTDDIFVDILPRSGEAAEEFDRRRDEMEGVVRAMHGERVEAQVVAVKGPVV